MIEKFLVIANDVWFDWEAFMRDTKGRFYWFQKPRSIYRGAHVYFYLSGKTKAVKYEFRVVGERLIYADLPEESNRYAKYGRGETAINLHIPPQSLMCELELIREIKDLAATSPRMLKERGHIMGRLMSGRALKPQGILYLDSVK